MIENNNICEMEMKNK